MAAAYGNLFQLGFLATTKRPTSAFDTVAYVPFRRRSIQALPKRPLRSTEEPAPPPGITSSDLVPFLCDACGLSPKSATTVAEQLRLKSTERAEEILQLLAEFGLSRDSIASFVTRSPAVLNIVSIGDLRLKLEFLRSSGFDGPLLGDLLASNPWVLNMVKKDRVAESMDLLMSLVPSGTSPLPFIIEVMKRSDTHLVTEKHLPNLLILESHGVPLPEVLNLLLTWPRALAVAPKRLEKVITMAKDFGIPVHISMFLRFVMATAAMAEGAVERKMNILKETGWSEGEVIMAVRRNPAWLTVSDRKLQQRAEFFRDVVLWTPQFIASNPQLLQFSVEKRFGPRCSVLSLLMQRGFVKRDVPGPSLFLIPDKAFQEQYVTAFRETVPEVAQAYKANCFRGWEMGCLDEFSYLTYYHKTRRPPYAKTRKISRSSKYIEQGN